jgi:hypothetical protein
MLLRPSSPAARSLPKRSEGLPQIWGREQARSARRTLNFSLLKPYARPSLSLRLPDLGDKKYHGTGDNRAKALYNEIKR